MKKLILLLAGLCAPLLHAADLTLSTNMDDFLTSANYAEARTKLGLGALATVTPGTGIATALAINVGSAGAPVLLNGAGGTPSAINLANGTALPISGITASTSTALGVGSLELGHASDTTIARSSAGVVTIEGVVITTATNTLTLTNKTLTSPVINGGALTDVTLSGTTTVDTVNATTFQIGGVAVTSTAAELNILDGATLTVTELNYVDGVTSAIQTQLDAKTTPTSTETMTNKRITARVTTIVSSATPTVNTDNCDAVKITALAAAITSMTTNLSGTPADFDQLEYRIKDDGTARAITWGASFSTGTGTLPTTTTLGKVLHVFFEWDPAQSKWICLSTGSEP